MLYPRLLLLFALVLLVPGCEAIVSIFEAGVVIGVIGALVLIGIIVLVVSQLRR